MPIDQPDAEAQRLAVQSRSSPIANPDHTAIGSCVPLGTIALPTTNLQPMTQDTKTYYEAIEQQILELFEQLPPDAQSDLLDELIGMTTPNDEDDD